MFCPNCGKDCGDANFCSHCGSKLANAAAQTSAWSVGMPCPHCGGTKLEGNNCAFCGAQLMSSAVIDNSPDDGLYTIPLGKYNCVSGSITLYDTACVIITRTGLFRKCETRISYDEITSVMYYRPHFDNASFSYLVFRWTGNKNEPIPTGREIHVDSTSLAIPTESDALFFHIYYMLKAIAPSSAEFKLIDLAANESTVFKQVNITDIESLFTQYSPHRDRAIEAFRKTARIKLNEARILVNRLFDSKLKEIYDSNPRAAIRDLNIVINEIERQNEEQQKKLEQERKERETMYRLEALAKQNKRS